MTIPTYSLIIIGLIDVPNTLYILQNNNNLESRTYLWFIRRPDQMNGHSLRGLRFEWTAKWNVMANGHELWWRTATNFGSERPRTLVANGPPNTEWPFIRSGPFLMPTCLRVSKSKNWVADLTSVGGARSDLWKMAILHLVYYILYIVWNHYNERSWVELTFCKSRFVIRIISKSWIFLKDTQVFNVLKDLLINWKNRVKSNLKY